MKRQTTLEDIIGLEHTKLGFFGELKKTIAELRDSNIELERRQREIKAILDGITDVMAVVSFNFTIISVNHVFSEAFQREDPKGKVCYRVFRNRTSPCPDCPMVIARETNRVCRKLAIFSLGGKNHQVEITASPMRWSNGRSYRFLLLMRDVTREKEYQARYYHAEKMATIGVLAAGVAHEINNPLTAVSGFAKGLTRRLSRLEACMDDTRESRELMADFTEYLETILSEGERCRDIVHELLTFSPRKEGVFAPVDLRTLVLEMLKLLRYQLNRRTSRLICLELDESVPPVLGVGAELKQVLLNLIFNALEAIRDKGTITIRTGKTDRWIVLSVRDTGCGIPSDNLDKLFDPFFTTKPVGQGTGIGLSTCYNIIRQHKGEITVESVENLGSTFHVKLPIPAMGENQ
ncbi:two-component system sensor histidine kinase NtrB [Desulfoluna spongiiphila]|uniref:two-component system sensor histidine kinase NtrB n=1 Tax=Desulfoluna spongiiphila TaxID=419481 RepID=UPI0012598479|nr:ATP-binding protein [Desulfoluna spongiiphila]VVS94703.1 pas fold-4 [Desulfoluna spongiiphila]